MAISYALEGVKKPKLSYRLLNKCIKGIIVKEDKVPGDLTFVFCNDSYLIDINNKYLDHDYFTDIITFDYCEENIITGDIFISLDRVLENSNIFNVSFNDELLRVIIHGVLHLLGFGDNNDDQKVLMRDLESKFILIYKNLENGCLTNI